MSRLLFIGRMTIFAYGMRRMSQPSTRHLPPASQKFMPSLGLRVSGVLDLQPTVPVLPVNAEFSLRHNPLEVTGANFCEKGLAMLHDVLRIKQPWTLRGPDESRESLLSLDKGPLPQVLAIKPQKVERDWLPFSAEQLVELTDAPLVQADYLPVQNRRLHR